MTGEELRGLLNALPLPAGVAFAGEGRTLPAYLARMREGRQVVRHYADGGDLIRQEAELSVAKVCPFDAMKESLVEEVHLIAQILCTFLPMAVGEGEAVYASLLNTPTREKRGRAEVCTARFAIDERRGGRMRGVVPFFRRIGDMACYAPKGFFDVTFESENEVVKQEFLDEVGIWGQSGKTFDRLRCKFDRIPGAFAQEILLQLVGQCKRGKGSVMETVLCEMDKKERWGYPAVLYRASAIFEEYGIQERGTVFGGSLIPIEEGKKGWLDTDASGLWVFKYDGEVKDAGEGPA